MSDQRHLGGRPSPDGRAPEHGASEPDVTGLLLDWSDGDSTALDRLMPFLIADLRRQAAAYMRRERRGHTLQPTALVNEVYLRLVDQKRTRWKDRAHFFAVAAQLMRRILVDHARGRGRRKRGGDAQRVSLDEARDVALVRDVDVLALDQALDELARLDARQARVVELRFFGGLSLAEIAEVHGVHPITVSRDWRNARAWLLCHLGGENEATAQGTGAGRQDS